MVLTYAAAERTISTMRTIFIADAHLHEPSDHNYRMLMRFLHEIQGTTDTLVILGDLFDFWVGFPSQPFRQHEPLLVSLEKLVAGGCRLIYFEGNHDFHLGTSFSLRLQTEIHTGPAVLTLDGRRLYICHGDQINRKDYGYRLLRLLLHNRLTRLAIPFVPPPLAFQIKQQLQKSSQAGYEKKTARWDYTTMIRDFGESIRTGGCDGLVTGHFHLPFLDQSTDPLFTLLSLGDWISDFSYGEMVDGTISLRTYPNS